MATDLPVQDESSWYQNVAEVLGIVGGDTEMGEIVSRVAIRDLRHTETGTIS